jgi:predicted ATPase
MPTTNGVIRLVLLLEDLHWSDHATLDLIAWLAQRREPARLLLLGTYRPVDAMVQGHPLRAVMQALSWELRAAMSLSRLWQQQGKQAEARELLAPVYGWFTEGFDTADLQEAKSLLEELA